MNQYIKIRYNLEPNFWELCFFFRIDDHREKPPSFLQSDSYWAWYVYDKLQKSGNDFDWNKQ